MKYLSRKIGKVIFPPLAYIFMRTIWFMTFKKFHFINAIEERQYVCVTWHSELFLTPQAYRHIHKKQAAAAIVSSHFDGSLIAGTLNLLKIKPLRGSTRKNASKVLLQAFRHIKAGEEVLITPDGPKGPRHTMHDGVVAIALKSKLPIFLINYQAKSYWQLSSWDKFVIPKPFSKVDFYIQSLALDGMDLPEAKVYLRAKMLEYTMDIDTLS